MSIDYGIRDYIGGNRTTPGCAHICCYKDIEKEGGGAGN